MEQKQASVGRRGIEADIQGGWEQERECGSEGAVTGERALEEEERGRGVASTAQTSFGGPSPTTFPACLTGFTFHRA